MFSGIYSAAAAMDIVERRHEAASYNLANASMPGYRRWLVDQRPSASEPEERFAMDGGASSEELSAATPRPDLSHGSIQRTDNALDLALTGDGFFVVEGPDGPLYTRSGKFRLNGDGELVTVDGLHVRGTNGRITLSGREGSHEVRISDDGRVHADGTQIGQLSIVRIDDPDQLTPAGRTLFAAPEDVVSPDAKTGVLQGSLETSNVQPIEELVTILVGSRQYEAAQRIIRSLSELAQRNINTQNGN